MRKLAPAFVLSTIVALSSGTALAFGDMNKNKKAPSVNSTTTSAPAATPAEKTYTAPTNPSVSGAATASDTGKGGATATGNTPGATSSTLGSSSVASTDATASSSAMAGMEAKATGNCKGLSKSDPNYKLNNCDSPGAQKGGLGASAGN